mmetsp:Transcript_45997/g.92833  ORF Transcript_45997/g.92833 Transcript_45997/m.92833 type:complete len:122 (-) Transcript_45997:541-906(-)
MILFLAHYLLSPRYANRNLRLKAKVKLASSLVGLVLSLWTWASLSPSADSNYRGVLLLLQVECCLDVIGFLYILFSKTYGLETDPEELRPHPEGAPFFTEEEVFKPDNYRSQPQPTISLRC